MRERGRTARRRNRRNGGSADLIDNHLQSDYNSGVCLSGVGVKDGGGVPTMCPTAHRRERSV